MSDPIRGINPPFIERASVDTWMKWLSNNPSAGELPVQKIEHMKNFQQSPVHHEFLIITVNLPSNQPASTQRIIAERQTQLNPDQVIYGPWDDQASDLRHRSADLLSKLEFQEPHPQLSEIASTLVRIGNVRPSYGWNTGNCYWYSGSVAVQWESRAAVIANSPYIGDRGRFGNVRVGSDYVPVTAVAAEDQVQKRSADAFYRELPQEEAQNRRLQETVPEFIYPAAV